MRAKIDDILDEFDFEQVHKVMVFLKWEWSGEGVPTIGRLRKRAREMLNYAAEHADGTSGTGGFYVRKEVWDGETFLALSFVVTSWDNYD